VNKLIVQIVYGHVLPIKKIRIRECPLRLSHNPSHQSAAIYNQTALITFRIAQSRDPDIRRAVNTAHILGRDEYELLSNGPPRCLDL